MKLLAIVGGGGLAADGTLGERVRIARFQPVWGMPEPVGGDL